MERHGWFGWERARGAAGDARAAHARPPGGARRHDRGALGARRRGDRPGHRGCAGHLRGGAARGGRRRRARRRAARRRRARAACPRCARPGHHAEAARAMGFCFFNNVAVAAAHARAALRRRARADPRLGRAPRQRDERHLPRRSGRPVLLDPRVAAVSRDRPGGGRRVRRGGGLHGEPAGARRVGRRGVRLARRARRGAADPRLGSRSSCSSRRDSTPIAPIRSPPAG